MQLILLGIDGAEPSLVLRWANGGFLPNFARLIKSGAFGKCMSTLHPLTPQAWASIITGVGPGRHGIFDFGRREKNSYAHRLVDSRDRTFPAFWEMMGDKKKIGVVNVPLTYPPDPVNGFFISGMHTPELKKGVHPKGLEKQLPGYVIDAMSHWYAKGDQFVEDVKKMCLKRHELIFKLIKKHPVDVLFPVYVAADRIQHALWGRLTEKHLARPGWGGGEGDAVFEIYKMMDDILGDYMALADKEKANLVVVSDHGFGDLKKDVYLNALLLKHGLMAFDPKKVRAAKTDESPVALDPTHDWQRKIMPSGPPKPGTDKQIRVGNTDPRLKSFATVDWKKTVAYSAGLFGNVWINTKGREPHGIVAPGAEFENAREKVTQLLLSLVDPDDGRPVVDKVYKAEDIYSGPMVKMAPDLIVKMRDYSYITRGSTEFLCNDVVSKVVVNHTGNHRLFGIVGLWGQDIRKGHEITGASVYDVTPTVLMLAKCPIPKGLDGAPMENAVTGEFLAANPVGFFTPTKKVKAISKGFSKREQEIIKTRLRALGYLG